jgi:hypothetical protein
MKSPLDSDGIASQALNVLMAVLFGAVIIRLIYEALAPAFPWLIGMVVLAAIGRVSYGVYAWWRDRW